MHVAQRGALAEMLADFCGLHSAALQQRIGAPRFRAKARYHAAEFGLGTASQFGEMISSASSVFPVRSACDGIATSAE
jgi:hypothetical protein